jgi:hypothetical protein
MSDQGTRSKHTTSTCGQPGQGDSLGEEEDAWDNELVAYLEQRLAAARRLDR